MGQGSGVYSTRLLMKISELIAILSERAESHGDIEVLISHDNPMEEVTGIEDVVYMGPPSITGHNYLILTHP